MASEAFLNYVLGGFIAFWGLNLAASVFRSMVFK